MPAPGPNTRSHLEWLGFISYEVRAHRVEPVGLVYLWPDTG